jgi:hypothetical protein
MSYPGVASPTDTSMRGPEEDDAWILDIADELGDRISVAVVDDDQLERAHTLL